MANEQQVFLARGEEVSGPFTPEKIREMEANGELSEYTWMFDGSSPNWTALSPPPPVPMQLPYETEAVEAASPNTGLVSPQGLPPPLPAEPEPSGRIELAVGLLAVCHDFRSVMSGRLESAWPKGCVFLSPSLPSSLSPFRKGSRIWLNILHKATGSTENASVKVDGCRKRGEAEWEIHLAWDVIPKILKR